MNGNFGKYMILSVFLHLLFLGGVSIMSMTGPEKPVFSRSYSVELTSSSEMPGIKSSKDTSGKEQKSSETITRKKKEKTHTQKKETKKQKAKKKGSRVLKDKKEKPEEQNSSIKTSGEDTQNETPLETSRKKTPQKETKRGKSGKDASGKGPGGGDSSIARLDVGSFKYGWYLETIRRKVAGGWIKPSAGGSDVIVYFKIDSGGEIRNIKLEVSSGDTVVDRSCLRAVESADPLPELPRGFEKEKLGVHFKFLI